MVDSTLVGSRRSAGYRVKGTGYRSAPLCRSLYPVPCLLFPKQILLTTVYSSHTLALTRRVCYTEACPHSIRSRRAGALARQIHKERRMARLSVDINGEQRTFALTEKGIQIGRALDNDIVLNHAIVSRRHAQV